MYEEFFINQVNPAILWGVLIALILIIIRYLYNNVRILWLSIKLNIIYNSLPVNEWLSVAECKENGHQANLVKLLVDVLYNSNQAELRLSELGIKETKDLLFFVGSNDFGNGRYVIRQVPFEEMVRLRQDIVLFQTNSEWFEFKIMKRINPRRKRDWSWFLPKPRGLDPIGAPA